MKKALLVIDVQNEYFSGALPIRYPQGSFNNILKAMEAAKKNNILVIAIQHTDPNRGSSAFVRGSLEWELHEEVRKAGFDYLIEKNMPGSFTGTKLEEVLRENEIKKVAVCGYMTQMCCDTTARQASHLGFKVNFLSDSTGTLSIKNNAGEVEAEELHKSILVTQAMGFSEVVTTDEWVSSLKE